ncbi:MAG: PEP-CTERM sorting domain-containing protein [Burkholderiaceae bacterium]
MRINVVRKWMGILALLFAGSAMSQVLTYTRTDLPDVGTGDAWQYSYTFSGMLENFGGINLVYSPGAYANLSIASVPPIGTDFFDPATVMQPDTAAPADGLITLTSNAARSASYSTHFVVNFDKTGDLGDSHPFEVFDSSFNATSGTAMLAAAVPEPSSALMLVFGMLLVGTLYRRRLHPSAPPSGCT